MIAARIKSRPLTQRATLIPFPLARRRALVARLALEMGAARTAESAEKLLQGRLARLGRALRSHHVPEATITLELRGLELAVKAKLWCTLLAPSSRP